MRIKFDSLPTHGSAPYYSMQFNAFGKGIRLSFGGYDLTTTLEGFRRSFRILHYYRIATHFAFPGGCISVLYQPH